MAGPGTVMLAVVCVISLVVLLLLIVVEALATVTTVTQTVMLFVAVLLHVREICCVTHQHLSHLLPYVVSSYVEFFNSAELLFFLHIYSERFLLVMVDV